TCWCTFRDRPRPSSVHRAGEGVGIRLRPTLAMRRAILVLLSLAFALSCASPLESAIAKYRQNRDYQSLQVIERNLHEGMPRADVERLLGPPDYSPTDGQYVYSSNQHSRVLVVDYRRGDDVTDRLQRFDLEEMGE